MKTLILLAILSALALGGLAFAAQHLPPRTADQHGVLDYVTDSHMKKMDDGPCPPTNNLPPGQ